MTGGGSGGHVYPLLSVAESLEAIARAPATEYELHYFGPKDRYSATLAEAGITIHPITSSKIRRYASGLLANILDIPRFAFGFLQALFKMFWLMPDAIFSKGGPGAYPVVIAGWFYRIPVMIHDSDATPGLTNLLSGRFSKRIAVSFDRAAKYFDPRKTIVSGSPLRRALLEGRPDAAQAKEMLGFDPALALVVVLGGSQGSQRINEFIAFNIPELIKDVQIYHQAGSANYLEIKKVAQAELLGVSLMEELKSRYQVVPFIDDMKVVLAAADLVVSRAGSSSIFEVAAFGKPSILIPLHESANDHQRTNAYEYARGGGAVVIEEPNLLPAIFLNQIREILTQPETVQKMAAAATAFFKPGAGEVIAKELLILAGKSPN